jgi:AraC-like DNA-binding protein
MVAARDAWLASVVTSAQHFAGVLAEADPEDARALADDFAASLAPPPDRLHNLVLGALLLDTALRVSEYLHRLITTDRSCDCAALSRALLGTFLDWRERDATQAFLHWTEEFFSTYQRHHPPTPASRIARLIRQHPEQQWTLVSLSTAAGVPAGGLARAFRHEYAVGIREYVHLSRVSALLAQASSDVKIEAIALEAGYRSRKDFYRVLRQTLQTTPSLLRRLSPDQRLALQKRLRTRLLQRTLRRGTR